MVCYSYKEAGLSQGVEPMPLTRRQFELGIDEEAENWMRLVYDLLEGNRHLAYSFEELREAALGTTVLGAQVEKFQRSLDVLVRMGAVDKGEVAGNDYYTYYQEMDTATWTPVSREFAA